MNRPDPARRQEILAALQSKGARLPCPRCGNGGFELLEDGLPSADPSHGQGGITGGVGVPSAVVVCDRCGFMSRHALGVLGVLGAGRPSTSLVVLAAIYGAGGNVVDLTDIVAKAAVLKRVDVVVGNHLGGDPCPGFVKHLEVVYLHRGKRHVKTAREGETLSLP